MSEKVLNKVNNDIFSYSTDLNVFKMNRVMPTEIHHVSDGQGTSGYILTSGGTNGWTWTDPSTISGGPPLSNLTGVTISGLSNNQILSYDGSNWVNTDQSILKVGTSIKSTLPGNNVNASLSVSLGNYAGNSGQQDRTIAIGNYAASSNQSVFGIAIGAIAGQVDQSQYSIACGWAAGQFRQGETSIAIGKEAAVWDQGSYAIAIGAAAGCVNSQGYSAVAIGHAAGFDTQGNYTVALGNHTATNNQADGAVSIGDSAGRYSQQYGSVSVGRYAGHNNQYWSAVAIGNTAGHFYQKQQTVAIGYDCGRHNQNEYSVAIGANAARDDQGNEAVAIGYQAGYDNQGSQAVAVGLNTGYLNQGVSSVAVGQYSGNENQGTHSIAIGTNAARYDQLSYAIAIGADAGSGTTARAPPRGQQLESIAIGRGAGYDHQKERNIAIGPYAQYNTQNGSQSIAIGYRAAQTSQGGECVAIGFDAGNINQGNSSVAIGYEAGKSNQGALGVAIGNFTGNSNQGNYGVALGYNAGQTDQGQYSTALGSGAGQIQQGNFSTAIGYAAGYLGLSENSIAIGHAAAFLPDASLTNYIVINASGTSLDPASSNGFHVKPINSASNSNKLLYNSDTGEITYQPDSGATQLNDLSDVTNIKVGPPTLLIGASIPPGTSYSGYTAPRWTVVVDTGRYPAEYGEGCTFMGDAVARYTNKNAMYNTAFGHEAWRHGTGSENTAIGKYSAFSNTGSYNTAVGSDTLAGGSGSRNVSIGHGSGYATINGHDNIFVGYYANRQNMSGSNNIIIGTNIHASSTSVSNEITLGNSSNTLFRIPGLGGSNGDVLAYNNGYIEFVSSGTSGVPAPVISGGAGTTDITNYALVSNNADGTETKWLNVVPTTGVAHYDSQGWDELPHEQVVKINFHTLIMNNMTSYVDKVSGNHDQFEIKITGIYRIDVELVVRDFDKYSIFGLSLFVVRNRNDSRTIIARKNIQKKYQGDGWNHSEFHFVSLITHVIDTFNQGDIIYIWGQAIWMGNGANPVVLGNTNYSLGATKISFTRL